MGDKAEMDMDDEEDEGIDMDDNSSAKVDNDDDGLKPKYWRT